MKEKENVDSRMIYNLRIESLKPSQVLYVPVVPALPKRCPFSCLDRSLGDGEFITYSAAFEIQPMANKQSHLWHVRDID